MCSTVRNIRGFKGPKQQKWQILLSSSGARALKVQRVGIQRDIGAEMEYNTPNYVFISV